MIIALKRLIVPLVMILLLCAACSPAAVEQPSAATQDPAVSASEPSAETSGSPTAGDVKTKAPGQTELPPDMPKEPEEPAESPGGPQPEEPPDAAPSAAMPAVPPDDGPVVLTVSGDGVSGETTWTLNKLQSLRDGYRELTYSTTNNWPTFSAIEAHGISLTYLLRQAGIKDSAAAIKLISTDGYNATLTYGQVFGTLYSYSDHSASGSSGASAAEPVIAWEWGDAGKARAENIRPFFGQTGPWEVNTASFVKDLCEIEVSSAHPGAWDVPGSSVADGGIVPAGTEMEFTHGSMDSVRIYYTMDGSEPDYNSPVYNPSTSYFQPQLIKPITLEESVTLKAFAAGLGKERSPAVTLDIIVE